LAPIVFIDTYDYLEFCSISGTYTINDQKLSFTGSVKCGGKKETPIKLSDLPRNELVKKIVAEAVK
jgi:hypothetical protein